jgi:hypothetical protein
MQSQDFDERQQYLHSRLFHPQDGEFSMVFESHDEPSQ